MRLSPSAVNVGRDVERGAGAGPARVGELGAGRGRRARVGSAGAGALHAAVVARARAYLASRGMSPTEVQEAAFAALGAPGDVLVLAPTGSGKTAAVMLPVLGRLALAPRVGSAGVRALYVAPVRALVSGAAERIAELARGIGAAGVRVGLRTGDTPARARAAMARRPPEVLAVTPESLAVMLGTSARVMLEGVEVAVLDEVHALAAGKRGALLAGTLELLGELVVGAGGRRPRRIGLSATAGDADALACWMSGTAGAGTRRVVAGGSVAPVLELADPVFDAAYPSGGWAFRAVLPLVARRVAEARGTALVFVASRGRAEQWTLALRDVLPARMAVACHHGSLSGEAREAVALALAEGKLRAVVATSGLEAGVDLPGVSDVVVLAAPGSVTRLVQAAGRADHRPGSAPRATLVPIGAQDLVRCAAVLRAVREDGVEPVAPREGDLDVAVQVALGRVALGPCTRDALAATLRRAWPFRELTDEDVDAVLDFLATGGDALAAYPEQARVVAGAGGYALAGARSLRRYLRGVGTIVSEVAVPVRHGGAYVGQVEGRFAALLEVGERFVLAGRTWRVVARDADAIRVRPERADPGALPRWAGSRAPMSEAVARAAEAIWGELDAAAARGSAGALAGARRVLGVGEANARAVLQLVAAQRARSVVPGPRRFVVELVREGRRTHLLAYTFAGAPANEVIARAVAQRVRRATGLGAAVAARDETACVTVAGFGRLPSERRLRAWFAPGGLAGELAQAVAGGALAGQYFREVARIAQLWSPQPGHRGAVTPGLLYDVLRKHDPGHLLLRALAHTLWIELEGPRAERCLEALAGRRWEVVPLAAPSPLAVPVFAWTARDAVAPADPEAALAAAAHALYLRTLG